MARTYVTLETMKEDGKLYDNKLRDTVESLIPNPYESCHAADLLELPGGDLLCCWFAGSNEGNADISIVVSRLKAGESVEHSCQGIGRCRKIRTEPIAFPDAGRRNLADVYRADISCGQAGFEIQPSVYRRNKKENIQR